jgi:hypothetical protein
MSGPNLYTELFEGGEFEVTIVRVLENVGVFIFNEVFIIIIKS